LLLIAVAVLSAVFGELADAIAITVVIAAVAVLETATEIRADRAITALRAMSAPPPGSPTDNPCPPPTWYPATSSESPPATRSRPTPASSTPRAPGRRIDPHRRGATGGQKRRPLAAQTELAERSNMLHAGTAALAGEATAVVAATGLHSQLGQLGRLVADAREPRTPLQQTLTRPYPIRRLPRPGRRLRRSRHSEWTSPAP
jgi:Ca2+-transporting ATPase